MKDTELRIIKPGSTVFIGGKEKIEAVVIGARIGNCGSVYYEVSFWKDKSRIIEQVASFEITETTKEEKKFCIGFHEK
jgi:hypothetical protein